MSLIDALDFIEAGLTGYTVLLAVPCERSGYPAVFKTQDRISFWLLPVMRAASRSERVPGGWSRWAMRPANARWPSPTFLSCGARSVSVNGSYQKTPTSLQILTMLSECGRAVVVRCLSDPVTSRPVSPCPPNGSRMPRRKGVAMADKSPRKVASKKSGKTLKDKRKEKKEKQETRKGLGI